MNATPVMTMGRVSAMAAALLLAGGCVPAESPLPLAQAQASAAAPPAAAASEAPALLTDAQAHAQGERLAAQGVPGTAVAACSSCHGAQGEGNGAAGFPRLAGQPADYLRRQLELYAEGQRVNPVMQPIAKALDASQRQAAAVYYASLGPAPGSAAPPAGKAATAAATRGRVLAEVGDAKLRVQACANCHGPGGVGMAPLGPGLAAQPASYLEAALKAWADGSRNTDPAGQMPRIAKSLSDTDRAAVAAWYAARPAPPPITIAMRRPPPTRHPSEGPTGPVGSTPPPGAGAEQGTPSTGGAQGPGGGGATQEKK